MILHICNPDKKFILPFIDLINANFDPNSHFFLIYGGNKIDFPTEKYTNVEHWSFIWSLRKSFFASWKSVSRFFFLAKNSKKIILHGLFNNNLVILLAFISKFLKKSYWVIWGGDLYFYKFRTRNLFCNFVEFFRRIVIKRLGHFVTHIEGDYEIIKKNYKAKGKLHRCFMYTSNIFETIDFKKHNDQKNPIKVLVGNSADPSNNQLEVFEKLKKFQKEDIKIYVPLSYGNRVWAEKVITKGKEIFGETFYPLTAFMTLEEYKKFLASIDIGIFNHRRQQAMGNIVNLLGMGKKVYMRDDITTWEFFSKMNISLFSINDHKIDLNQLNSKDRKKNSQIIKNYFSKENLLRQLISIFLEEHPDGVL